MMNDKVREVLASRITPAISQRLVPRAMPLADENIVTPAPPAPERKTSAAPPAKRVETANLVAPKTSPTLVEFQNKKAPLPDWRLKVQNAVQQRRGADAAVSQPTPVRIGEDALAAAPPVEEQPVIADRRVENAMKRIAESRAAFLKPQPAAKKKPKLVPKTAPAPVQKQFPFDVVPPPVARNPMTAAAPARAASPVEKSAAAPAPIAVEKLDTNKLPPLQEVINEPDTATAPEIIKKVEPVKPIAEAKQPVAEFTEVRRIRIRVDNTEISSTIVENDIQEEIEDLAPFSMRFGAGLFDLIIGAFGGLLLISPVAFSTSEWFTASGILAFTGAWALFLFVYMTVCLGFYGKTLGMRLFALELVDAVENEYPTLRQAAVNSSVFILSLPLAGVGFITAIFNEEHRALHDLLSGTIQVREF